MAWRRGTSVTGLCGNFIVTGRPISNTCHISHTRKPLVSDRQRRPCRPPAFPVVRHDRLRPAALNELYNQSIAGLAMSFTHILLVAEEMLAAGVIPIVNESAYSRAD